MRKRSKVICEFCFKIMGPRSESTVCDDCDRELDKEQTSQLLLLQTTHSTKYKCQNCGTGLPLVRARTCEVCLPDSERQTDDSMYNHQLFIFKNAKWVS